MKPAANKRTGGYVLVQTLVVLTALTALMAIMAADEHASIEQTQNRIDRGRAEQAVNAGVARAIATLQTANTNLVTLNDAWAQVGQDGITPSNTVAIAPNEYQLNPPTGTDESAPTFRMQILDAGSLINLNDAAIASSLPAAQQTTAVDNITTQLLGLGLSQQQVDCLLDWEQTSTQARSDGAKDAFYNSLQMPYNTELGPMNTVNESLLVDNWTGQTLYQPPTAQQDSTQPLPVDINGNNLPIAALVTVDSGCPDTQASGAARIYMRTATPQQLSALGINSGAGQNGNSAIQQARQSATFAQLFALIPASRQEQALNTVTFTNSRWLGKINLNTASEAVLNTVPGMTTSIASAIVAQQASGFSTLGQLATVSGVTPAVLRQIADSFTVGSDTWLVRVYGHSGNVGVAVEAVVGIRNGEPQVITWEQINTPDVPAWWDWQPSTATVDAEQTT